MSRSAASGSRPKGENARVSSNVRAAIYGVITVATIIGIEVVSGVRAELALRELALQALVGTALGLLVVALRLALH